jgi:hypothetical protein
MERAAEVSGCGRYRYTLERHWDRAQGHVLFVLLNPSTADATQDDPTLRKGIGFAKRLGVGGVVFVNLFAWRSTDPRELPPVEEAITGRDEHGRSLNDLHIIAQADRVRWMSRGVILAWGAGVPQKSIAHRQRPAAVLRHLRSLDVALWCFGTNRDGSPKHPLYLRYGTQLVPFPAPAPRDSTGEGQ